MERLLGISFISNQKKNIFFRKRPQNLAIGDDQSQTDPSLIGDGQRCDWLILQLGFFPMTAFNDEANVLSLLNLVAS